MPWRKVRIGTEFEKQDRDFNACLVEELLCDPAADDFAMALDLTGFMIGPQDGRAA